MAESARACRGRVAHPGRAPLRSFARVAARRLGLDSNPLCRTSDRIEAWARLATAGVVLVALPLTLVVGSRVHDELLGIASAQAASHARHTATVIDDPVRAVGRIPTPTRAAVTWRDAAGQDYVVTAAVPSGARRGDEVEIWTSVDAPAATTSHRPFTDRDALKLTVLVVALLAALVLSAASLALQAVVGAIDRRRHRQWDVAWSRLDDGRIR